MKTSRLFLSGLILTAVLTTQRGFSEPPKPASAVTKVLEMKSVPDGNYRVTLQLRGRERALNFEAKDNLARCIRSDDPKLEGLQGTFELIGNGVFLISLRNDNHRATQYWLVKEDGGATVKEIPDRGEKQTAERVAGTFLDAPAK